MTRPPFSLLLFCLFGCSMTHADYPSRACRSSRDCFVAQGEICDIQMGRCVVAGARDAGPEPAHDARPDDANTDVDADLPQADGDAQ